jgi:hypothetical protein
MKAQNNEPIMDKRLNRAKICMDANDKGKYVMIAEARSASSSRRLVVMRDDGWSEA